MQSIWFNNYAFFLLFLTNFNLFLLAAMLTAKGIWAWFFINHEISDSHTPGNVFEASQTINESYILWFIQFLQEHNTYKQRSLHRIATSKPRKFCLIKTSKWHQTGAFCIIL